MLVTSGGSGGSAKPPVLIKSSGTASVQSRVLWCVAASVRPRAANAMERDGLHMFNHAMYVEP